MLDRKRPLGPAQNDHTQLGIWRGADRLDGTTHCRGALGQALPDRPYVILVPNEWHTRRLLAAWKICRVGQIRMQQQRLVTIGKKATVAGVEIALGCEP